MKNVEADVVACLRMVSTLGLFSDNESKDDITTSSMKYLLLPYYLGLCHMHADPGRGDRLERCEAAAGCFRDFVRECADKGVLEDAMKPFEERMLGDGGSGSGGGGGTPLRFSRDEKIALYRRQKELQQHMASLSRLEADEENARSLHLLRINTSAMLACQHYASLQQECELLAFQKEREKAMERSGGAQAFAAQEAARREERARQQRETFASLKSAAATLQADRERFAQGVFKPSHILPTMTVEEFGELELRRMQERERERQQQGPGQQGGRGDRCCSDDDHSEDEECVKKAREWDDFKDDNPFGSGNSKLRPCG
uniref:TAP42-like protein n=1 Tax=Chloropicon laureae TaxID=464258 RepID=A0A7S2Z393_9CHLO